MIKEKITNIEFAGLDYSDYPDFCDAYISHACYGTRPLNDEELDQINQDREWVDDKLWQWIM